MRRRAGVGAHRLRLVTLLAFTSETFTRLAFSVKQMLSNTVKLVSFVCRSAACNRHTRVSRRCDTEAWVRVT